jgi:predicted cupin superfamily sugar epimerase
MPHPEGGFYRETYRSAQTISTPHGERPALTSILFLLTFESFSAFHRIASDEAWHYYLGDPLAIHVLSAGGARERRVLSARGLRQTVVPARAAFASEVERPGGYALVGCDVAPGFEFADFELCGRSQLSLEFPAHSELIARLTR